jgi:hypothetical protein
MRRPLFGAYRQFLGQTQRAASGRFDTFGAPFGNGRYLHIPAEDRVEETAIPCGTLAEEIGDIGVVVNDDD